MTTVEIFRAPSGQDIRTVMIDGQPWFVVADLAKILGYRDASNAARLLRPGQQGYSDVSTPSGLQRMLITNEGGLNRLILRANTPDAERIQDWITDEVMPTIARTGGYGKSDAVALGDPLDELAIQTQRTTRAIEIAKAERAGRLAAEAHAAALEPAARAWDVLASANGDYSVREAAYALNRDPQISIGQNRLFAWLRESGWLDRNSIPYATHATHVTLRVYSFPDRETGEERTAQQVRVTVAGLRLLHRRLGGIAPLQLTVPADVEVAA